MSLSAERIAIANQAITRTFAQTSIAWQAVPHWDVGDPGRVRVGAEARYRFPDPLPAGPPAVPPIPKLSKAPLPLRSLHVTAKSVRFAVTLAQATADTPDAVLAAVIARTVVLARKMDEDVLAALADAPKWAWSQTCRVAVDKQDERRALEDLIGGRELLEDCGYRASSCLIASTKFFNAVNLFVVDRLSTGGLLNAAGVNAVHRATQFNGPDAGTMVMLGRVHDIESGCAATASAGDEPVDLAICVPPSLEVIGEDGRGNILLAVRVRYATRIKDPRAIIRFVTPPPEADDAADDAAEPHVVAEPNVVAEDPPPAQPRP